MKTIKELFELSEKHNYYCSDSSYFGLGFETEYKTWNDFIAEMGSSDLDMNLMFRWDISKSDDGLYSMSVFIVHQRKGRFVPFFIESVDDSDVDSILDLLRVRKNHLNNLWEGI